MKLVVKNPYEDSKEKSPPVYMWLEKREDGDVLIKVKLKDDVFSLGCIKSNSLLIRSMYPENLWLGYLKERDWK